MKLYRCPTTLWLISFLLVVAVQPTAAQSASRTQPLINELAQEGITPRDFDQSTPVMQDFAAGRIDEQEARSRLQRVADGKLVKSVSNQLFRRLFCRAELSDFIEALAARGYMTGRLAELQSEINVYFRPQTEQCAAQWEFITNTMFIPVEYGESGTNRVRGNLKPLEINTVIHELDHAAVDLRNDLLRMRGKSLSGKMHAGFCWGALLCVPGLLLTTLLGNLFRLQWIIPALGGTKALRWLTYPQVALAVVVGSAAAGIGGAVACHWVAPEEFHVYDRLEFEHVRQLTRICDVIDADPDQRHNRETTPETSQDALARQYREALRLGIPGLFAGAAVGLALGGMGYGLRLLGPLRILRALSYPWGLAITCGLIGGIGLASCGAWQTNSFSQIKAMEISGYFAGYCIQQILEGQDDIAAYNTTTLHVLTLADCEALREADQQGRLRLLLPPRMIRMPDTRRPLPKTSLSQLGPDYPGGVLRFGEIGPDFEAYLADGRIQFPYHEHPEVFAVLFRTSLGLGFDRITIDRNRNEFNYRGLADFMELSDLPRFVQLREQVRQAQTRRYQELQHSPATATD